MSKSDKRMVLICWNKHNYSYVKDNITQTSTHPSYPQAKWSFCFDDLLYAKENYLDKITHIIVLCELQWTKDVNNGAYSDMHGIRLVQRYIRKEWKISKPVIFISFLSRKQIIDLHPDLSIISTPALHHFFFDIFDVLDKWKCPKCTNIILKNIACKCGYNYYWNNDQTFNLIINKIEKEKEVQCPMSELQLEYTIGNFCSLGGLVRQIKHPIESCSLKEGFESIIQKLDSLSDHMDEDMKCRFNNINQLVKNLGTEKNNIKIIQRKISSICYELENLLSR